MTAGGETNAGPDRSAKIGGQPGAVPEEGMQPTQCGLRPGWPPVRGWWLVGLVMTVLVVAVTAFILAAPRGEEGLDRVLRTGVLRVGLDASFPPFETLDETGRVIGLDADLAQAIAADLGARAEFVNIGFDGLYDALAAGRVDVVISGLPYDERRTRDARYSRPYFDAGQVLVGRSGHEGDKTDWELAKTWLDGGVVAVEWGSLGDMTARRWRNDGLAVEILAVDDAPAALAAVERGEARAAVVDAVSAYATVGQPDGLAIMLFVSDEPYVIASDLKSPRLARKVDEALSRLRASGELSAIEERWLGP